MEGEREGEREKARERRREREGEREKAREAVHSTPGHLRFGEFSNYKQRLRPD